MARFLAFLVLLLALAITVSALFRGSRSRSDQTYRPRAGWRDWFGLGTRAAGNAGLAHVVRRQDLGNVRDAYSTAAIDADQPLWRCSSCQGFYGKASMMELQRANHGRCAACGGTDINPVRVIDQP